jgi:hypothetical protein
MMEGRGRTLVALAVAILIASSLGRFGVHMGVAELNFAW